MSKVSRKSKTPVVEVPAPVVEEPAVVEPAATEEPTVVESEGVSLRDQLDTLIRVRNEDIRRLREEILALKRMTRQYLVERKNANRRRKRPVDPDAPKRVSGFAKPCLVSDACYKFLEPMGVERGSLISRIAVTKHIHDYIKKNNLKNPEFGKEFFPDKKLKALLGPATHPKDKNDSSKGLMYSTMGIQTYIKSHFKKAGDA